MSESTWWMPAVDAPKRQETPASRWEIPTALGIQFAVDYDAKLHVSFPDGKDEDIAKYLRAMLDSERDRMAVTTTL